jgi:hypothetical protein
MGRGEMIKFTGRIDKGGTLYGFGLSEANLNRLVFNREPIFFSFDYAGLPHLFGLILYFDCPTPEELNLEVVQQACLPFLSPEHGVTVNTLRVMALTKSIVDQFRATPFWQHSTKILIAHPEDVQMIFAGPDEQAIEEYMRDAGFIGPKTKRISKGFGGSR